MDYKIEYPEKNTAVISYTVPSETWQAQLDDTKKAMGTEDDGAVEQNLVTKIASEILNEALAKDNLKLATQPTLLANRQDNGDMIITLTLSLLPEVKLGEYTGFGLVRAVTPVSDEELMEHVNAEVEKTKLFQDLPADDGAKNGDRVIIDFVGEKDGVPFEGGSAKEFPLVLGSQSFIPGFEDQLIGIKRGESRDVNVSFPEDYFEKSLAGQPVVFHVTCQMVQEEIPSVLSDDFIQRMQIEGVKTVEDLKAKIKDQLEELHKQEADNEVMRQVLDRIIANADVEVPVAMINSRVDQHIQESENSLRQYGMSVEDFLKQVGESMENMREQIKPQAEQELKAALVIEAIAEKENIEADEKAIETEYKILSNMYGMPAEQLKMFIPTGSVAASIIQNKTMDFLKESNVKDAD